ncbi:hypothetical protein DRQ53_11955 [bacterium]|nr:MAG: hypothetical protein DRQ53_11955 [bacterium]
MLLTYGWVEMNVHRYWSRRIARIVWLLLVLLLPSTAHAQIENLETERLRIIYIAPLHSYLAPYAARCFENSLSAQQRIFDYTPDEKITVILTDFSDYGNAGAGAVPRSGVAVSIAPMNMVYETYPSNERINTLANHELIHVANFDQAAGIDPFFRRLFLGKVRGRAAHPETILYNYLTAPRASAPRWFHEGIATFVETWMAGGIGRAQGSYDEMVFRSMVRDGTSFYDPLSLVSEGTKANFQVEMNSYLYGTRFMSWVAWQHSPEKLIDWVRRSEGSRGFHARQYEKLFGQSLQDGWSDWVEYEREFQQVNLDSLRQHPLTEVQDIGTEALGSVSRAYYDHDTDRIYAALNYPGTFPHIASIDASSGEIERLEDVKGPMMYTVTSLAFDPLGKRLFYSADNGALRDIMLYDIASDKARKVLADGRVGDLAYDRSDSSLWGVRHDSGYASLVRVPEPYDEWNLVHTFDFGFIPHDLDVAPDGSKVAFTLVRPSGDAELQICERDSLIAGQVEPVARFGFGTTAPLNFVFDETSEHLVGTTYLTGVSNVFSIDLARGEWDALSNVETGLFRPIPVEGDSLIVFRYSGDGFVPARMQGQPLEDIAPIRFFGERIMDRYPELADWRVGSPAEVPIDSMITYRGNYRPWRSLELESIYPIVEGYKDYAAVGLKMDLSDPLSMNRISASASYTPTSRLDSDERLHLALDYHRHGWNMYGRYNDADFYDLFGPTKTSLKGYTMGGGYSRILIYDMPKEMSLDVDAAFYGDLERVPDYQNVSASFSELLTGSVRLNFKNLRFSLGAVDYEKGVKSFLQLADNHVNGRSFVTLLGSMQLGLPLYRHSSVWIRGYGGVAPPDRDEPFSNFFFGGFGNNYVDDGSIKRYRQWYAMPGFELNEVGGTNFLKLMGDLNLPPWRFRRGGRPSFYASWLRASVFATALATNVDTADLRTESANVGGQIDLRMTLLSHHDLTASVGYAVGFTEGRRGQDELMISLRIH